MKILFKEIEEILKEKTKEVVFTHLKSGKSVQIGGYELDSKIPLPVISDTVINKVKGKNIDKIKIDSIVKGMIKVIGIDHEFKYVKEYKEFLMAFDPDVGMKILKNSLYYASKEEFIEALIHLKAAYLFEGGTLDILFNYGKVCDRLSEEYEEDKKGKKFLKEANEVFHLIVQKYPEFPDAYYFLGFHDALQSEYKKAKDRFQESIEKGLDDNKKQKVIEIIKDIDDKIAFEEGSSLILNERYQEGLEILLSLEEFHKDWWNLLFFIGLAYRRINQFHKAIEYFRRTLEYNSGHIDTFNELGICYLSTNQISHAKKVYKEALKFEPENHELLCNLAIVYLNEENLEMAEDLLLKAHTIDKEDEIINAWLKKLELLKSQS